MEPFIQVKHRVSMALNLSCSKKAGKRKIADLWFSKKPNKDIFLCSAHSLRFSIFGFS